MSFSHDTYISPLTWRYGSQEMRAIWSELHKRRQLRNFWVALATGQNACGLVTDSQLQELRRNRDKVDLARAAEIESEIRHDLMAEIKVFGEQCPGASGIIHLGATSNDALDNVDALRMRDSLDLLIGGLKDLLNCLRQRILVWSEVPTMAFTHIQPAEPTTVGYRLACYAQDLLLDLDNIQRLRRELRGKGVKGAVGSAASYSELLKGTGTSPEQLECMVMAELGISALPVATQTMTRKQELDIVAGLGSLASSLHKLALDSRFLQGQMIGEWMEEFGERQVGSSAMPFKRNPIMAESICSLARQISSQYAVAWQNHAHAILERSLDDSANRRLFLPEVFLLSDEIVRRTNALVERLTLVEDSRQRTMDRFGAFAAIERVMLAATREGGDRQQLHEILREHSMQAWTDMQSGKPHGLEDRLSGDQRITRFVGPEAVRAMVADPDSYVGDAAARARAMAEKVEEAV